MIAIRLAGELAHKDSLGNGDAGAANSGVLRPAGRAAEVLFSDLARHR